MVKLLIKCPDLFRLFCCILFAYKRYRLPLPDHRKDLLLIFPVVIFHASDIHHVALCAITVLKEFPDMVRQAAVLKINACAVVFLCIFILPVLFF